MLEMNMGVQGAKRSRYFPDSPDALLRKVVEANPNATETELEEIFEEQVLKYGGDIISAIIAYWFANRYRALVRDLTPVSKRRQQKAAKEKIIQERAQIVKKAAVAKIARTLLDSTAPACGKQISKMTKEDCRREGGWFMSLAKKLRPRQTVQQANITDEELWAIYKENKGK